MSQKRRAVHDGESAVPACGPQRPHAPIDARGRVPAINPG
jgi:hypothetical protein